MQPGSGIAFDRRSATRRRTLLSGIVRYNARKSSLTCRVRNLSATGAQLEVTGAVWVPDQFELDISHHDLRAPVRVIWRDNERLGLKFIAQNQSEMPSLSQGDKISALQLEREKLKARVRELSNEF